MTPEQFLAKITKLPLSPAYLFLGQEGYQRRLCREALVDRIAIHISQQAFAADPSQSSVIDAVKLDSQLYDTLWQRVRRVGLLAFTPNAQAWTEHGIDRESGAPPLLRRWKRLIEKYAHH